jgi:hypothetical protein
MGGKPWEEVNGSLLRFAPIGCTLAIEHPFYKLADPHRPVARCMWEVGTMWRHGDVLIAAVGAIPDGATELKHTVLARGEITGHSHRILERDAAELRESGGTLYLKITADQATVVHQEHRPITLPRGAYRVWIQREYSPTAIRRVMD